MNVYKQHYSKSDKSEKVAADMNVVDQRQHNKRKRIQRQRMFAKKRKKIHYNILDKKKQFYFQGSESDRPTCQGVLGLSFIYTWNVLLNLRQFRLMQGCVCEP